MHPEQGIGSYKRQVMASAIAQRSEGGRGEHAVKDDRVEIEKEK